MRRHSTLIIVSRAGFIEDGSQRRFHDLDGAYIEDIGALFEKVILLAPVYRKGRDAYYEMMKDFRFEFRLPGLEIVELPEAGGARKLTVLLRTFWNQWRILRRVLREHRDALVYVFFPTYRAAAAALLCAWQSRPYLVYSGGMWAETIRLSPRWGGKPPWFLPLYVAACTRLEQLAYRHASVRFFFEAVRLREYEEIGPTYRVRPSNRLRPDPSLPARTLGWPARLLCVGDLLPGKGHDTLFEAIALLLKKPLPVVLTLAGSADNPWHRRLNELAARLNISESISYRGWVGETEQLRQLYRESDVFVLPTRSEGFPRVLYEALGQALPVVTTSIPNIALVLDSEQQALLVPPDDPSVLAAAIERVLRDDALRRRLGESGWRWAQEQFSETDAEQFRRVVCEHL